MNDTNELGALAVISGRCITNGGEPALTVHIVTDPVTKSRAISPELADSLTRLFSLAPDMLAALRRIANETCDHGPGFCPRDYAKATLAALGVAL